MKSNTNNNSDAHNTANTIITTNQYSKELAVAIAAVAQAAKVCKHVQANLVTADTLEKRDKSPVTVADFASQAVVCAALADAFPDDAVVGEEAADALRTEDQKVLRDAVVSHVRSAMSNTENQVCANEETILSWIDRGNADGTTKRFWTLDPIDGTKGFLRGQQYAVALALIENGQVVLGVLGCPNLPGPTGSGNGLIMSAVTGQSTAIQSTSDGKNQNASQVQPCNIADTKGARFCESVESGHSDQDASVQIAKKLGITTESVRMDSQCKYAVVARGDASIYLRLPTHADYQEKIWDHAAGMIVVQEAGGTVTDISGKTLDFTQGQTLAKNHGIIATTGNIHQQVLTAVSEVLNA